MSFKFETQGILQSFISCVETQFNCCIKTLRTNNETKISSMKQYLDTKGINYHNSCAYTHQKNGVVERKHHHLLNVGRALRFQANPLLKFWEESVQTINHLPTPFFFLQIVIPTSLYITSYLHIIIYELLDVFFMPPISYPHINLIKELVNAYLLVILLVKRVIGFMILKIINFFLPEMLSFMNIYFRSTIIHKKSNMMWSFFLDHKPHMNP